MPQLERELDHFHSVRLKTLEIAEKILEEELHRRPKAGEWSTGEVLDHLVLGMRFYSGEIAELIDLAKKGKEPVLKRSFSQFNPSILHIPRSILASMSWFLSLVSRLLPDRFRAWVMRSRSVPTQNPDVANPRSGRSRMEIIQDLHSSWNDFEALFDANQDIDFRRLYHKHPLMGKSNVLMLLRLLSLHESRHQDQIRFIEQSLNRK